MGAERVDDDGVHDQARDDRPVRVGADDRLVDQLLDHDDHPVGGERRLLLAAEQPPDLGVAVRPSERWAWTIVTSGLSGGTA